MVSCTAAERNSLKTSQRILKIISALEKIYLLFYAAGIVLFSAEVDGCTVEPPIAFVTYTGLRSCLMSSFIPEVVPWLHRLFKQTMKYFHVLNYKQYYFKKFLEQIHFKFCLCNVCTTFRLN